MIVENQVVGAGGKKEKKNQVFENNRLFVTRLTKSLKFCIQNLM